jgi:hypothetical protein
MPRIRHDLDLFVCLPPRSGFGSPSCRPARWVEYETGEWRLIVADEPEPLRLVGTPATEGRTVLVFLLKTLMPKSA